MIVPLSDVNMTYNSPEKCEHSSFSLPFDIDVLMWLNKAVYRVHLLPFCYTSTFV